MTCPDDYNVVMMPFPGDILAVVRVDANGYPTVYINDYLSPEAKKQALRHELWHFANGDFDSHTTIYDVEKQAAYAERGEPIFRSFRPITQEDEAHMIAVGLSLLPPPPKECFTLPLPMPEPMFDGFKPRGIAER